MSSTAPDDVFIQNLFNSFHMSMEERLRDTPMLTMLQTLLPEAVRLRVLAIQRRGGPAADDFQRIANLSEELGDTPLFSTKKDHKAAHQFNALAEALAVLSFVLGGITVFGIHFEAEALRKQWGFPEPETEMRENDERDQSTLLARDLPRKDERMHTLSSVQAGAKLLAAAMRDPAPILNLTTFWDFMRIVEAAASHLTDKEKAGPLYRDHVACYDRVYQARTDMIPVNDGQMMQMGEQLIEALASYAEQAADLLPVLLEHGNAAWEAALRQEFTDVFSRVERDIEEVPGGPEVQQTLAIFRQWTQREHADVLYNQALDLYDQQQYTECLELLGQALPLEPDRAHIYYARGNTRTAMKEYRSAAAEYLWAQRCAPYHFEAAMNLGCAYEALEQYEKSIVQYQRALEIDPESAVAHYNLGGAYNALGKLSEALAALNTAIELDPVFAGCYLNRANTLSRLGRHEEARANYHQALALEPDDSNIAWTATWAQFEDEGLDDAQVGELQRIAGLDPLHYTAHCCLAVLAYQQANSQAALQHLEQAVTLAPKEWDSHFWVGLVSAYAGETEIARQAIEHALDLGLPPVLLTPLSWLKNTHTDFFERYAGELLQRFGVNAPE